MIKTRLLKNKIEEVFGEDKLTVFYKKFGNVPFTVRNKINGKVECTVSDIKRFQKLLHLTDDEMLVIFFGKKVDE